MIATSINMQYQVFNSITRAAIRRNVSKRDIVVQLLMMIMRDVKVFRKDFRAVRYQPDDSCRTWYCFSIKYKPEESEFFSDLRNFCKCSVSLLVAMAVEKYLDELIDSDQQNVINYYPFSGYMVEQEICEGLITWKIYWGVAEKQKHEKLE